MQKGQTLQVAIGKINGKRVVLTSKKLNILMRDQHFSTAALSEMELNNVDMRELEVNIYHFY